MASARVLAIWCMDWPAVAARVCGYEITPGPQGRAHPRGLGRISGVRLQINGVDGDGLRSRAGDLVYGLARGGRSACVPPGTRSCWAPFFDVEQPVQAAGRAYVAPVDATHRGVEQDACAEVRAAAAWAICLCPPRHTVLLGTIF